MNPVKRLFATGALCGLVGMTPFSIAQAQADAIAALERADKSAGVTAPSLAETRAIAEEGFVYGLPVVMNYAVMYEYAVDKNSGQFKAPFNKIKNEPRVYTYEDTAIVTPNSDTPYSFVWMDLRAEPMVLSVPAVEKNRSSCDLDGGHYERKKYKISRSRYPG